MLGLPDGLTMTIDFCDAYVAACAGQLEFAADYCTTHTLGGDVDPYWSYPLTIGKQGGCTEVLSRDWPSVHWEMRCY